MSCELSSIPDKGCGTNAPGGARLLAAKLADVESMTATNKSIATITMKAGKTFQEIFFTHMTGSLTANYNGEMLHSDVFSAQAQVFVSKMRAALNKAIEDLVSQQLVLIEVDYNGTAHVVGRKSQPAFLTGIEGGTGTTEPNQRNGYQLTLSQPFATGLPDIFTGNIDALLPAPAPEPEPEPEG
jgi:hypothetical protein